MGTISYSPSECEDLPGATATTVPTATGGDCKPIRPVKQAKVVQARPRTPAGQSETFGGCRSGWWTAGSRRYRIGY